MLKKGKFIDAGVMNINYRGPDNITANLIDILNFWLVFAEIEYVKSISPLLVYREHQDIFRSSFE
jgi:hypothetical protein